MNRVESVYIEPVSKVYYYGRAFGEFNYAKIASMSGNKILVFNDKEKEQKLKSPKNTVYISDSLQKALALKSCYGQRFIKLIDRDSFSIGCDEYTISSTFNSEKFFYFEYFKKCKIFKMKFKRPEVIFLDVKSCVSSGQSHDSHMFIFMEIIIYDCERNCFSTHNFPLKNTSKLVAIILLYQNTVHVLSNILYSVRISDSLKGNLDIKISSYLSESDLLERFSTLIEKELVFSNIVVFDSSFSTRFLISMTEKYRFCRNFYTFLSNSIEIWRLVKFDQTSSLKSFCRNEILMYYLTIALPSQYSLNFFDKAFFYCLSMRLLYERTPLFKVPIMCALLCGINLQETWTRGSQYKVEALLTKTCRIYNFIMPSPTSSDVSKQRKFESVPLVMEPKGSLFLNDHVSVFDFRSLYPSIIIAYNIWYMFYNFSYTTILGNLLTPSTLGVKSNYKISFISENDLI